MIQLCRALAFVLVVMMMTSSRADASGSSCMPSLKRLLCPLSGYKKLAEFLFEEAEKDDLGHFQELAGDLICPTSLNGACNEFEKLLKDFRLIKPSPERGLCGQDSMRGLRHMAESMNREWRSKSSKTSKPIQQLNLVIMRLIEAARTACPPMILRNTHVYVNGLRFNQPRSVGYLAELGDLAQSFLFEEFDASRSSKSAEVEAQQKSARRLMNVINNEHKLTSGAADALSEKLIADQIQQFLDANCHEFLQVTGYLLSPLSNLLVALYIVREDKQSIEDFLLERQREQQSISSGPEYRVALDNAIRYGFCDKLKGMDKEHLAKLAIREQGRLKKYID